MCSTTGENRQLIKRLGRSRIFKGTIFILMSLPLPIHTVTAALDLPRGNADRSVKAKVICDACAGSTYVMVPPATITAINVDITAYKAATPGTCVNLWRIVHNDLKGFDELISKCCKC
jgi:hypothetical protein